MSLSSIQTNVAALLQKAYSTDTGAVAASQTATSVAKDSATATDSSSTASASTEVTLGEKGTTAQVYTAQGLLQQMREYQLSNTSLLFGADDSSEDDSSGLLGVMGGSTQSADSEGTSQNWVNTITQNPDQAAVMVQNSKNSAISTILGGQN